MTDFDDDEIEDSAPIFGEGVLDLRTWRMVIHGPTDPPEGHVERFRGYQDIDAGMVIRVMRAPDQARQMEASALLILNTASDRDGLSVTYRPPRVQQDDPRLSDPDFDLVPGDVDEDHEDFDDRIDDPAKWSSRRRLGWIFDDPQQHVKGRAIEELARWLVREGSGRPTGKPTRSSRGRTPAGRGSEATQY